MAEDIDDLLDEVETKFVKDKSSSKRISNSRPSRRKQIDEDIDQLIDDICGDQDPLEKCNIVQSGPVKKDVQREISSKCFPLYLGGSSTPKGLGSSFSKKSCDSIRCTSCDFKVVSFDDFEWDETTDYLFLRNHVPDFEKLKSRLNRKRAVSSTHLIHLRDSVQDYRVRAYCCQCSHSSVIVPTDVKDFQLKWVCGKH